MQISDVPTIEKLGYENIGQVQIFSVSSNLSCFLIKQSSSSFSFVLMYTLSTKNGLAAWVFTL